MPVLKKYLSIYQNLFVIVRRSTVPSNLLPAAAKSLVFAIAAETVLQNIGCFTMAAGVSLMQGNDSILQGDDSILHGEISIMKDPTSILVVVSFFISLFPMIFDIGKCVGDFDKL